MLGSPGQQEPYGYVGLLVDELILSPGRFLKLQISAFETLQKDDDQTLFAKPQYRNLNLTPFALWPLGRLKSEVLAA